MTDSSMVFFRIAYYESDCHGGGYYDDLKINDPFLDNFEFQMQRVKDLDCRVVFGGKSFNIEAYDRITNRNHILHYADIRKDGLHSGWLQRCITWDVHYFLFICTKTEWEKIYAACFDYGIHREWELKTYYDGIVYKRVVLDYLNGCE